MLTHSNVRNRFTKHSICVGFLSLVLQYLVHILITCIFFNILFIYSWEAHTEREAETQAEQNQAPCREPDVGFDPRSLGSHHGLKAVLNRWATQAAQLIYDLENRVIWHRKEFWKAGRQQVLDNIKLSLGPGSLKKTLWGHYVGA